MKLRSCFIGPFSVAFLLVTLFSTVSAVTRDGVTLPDIEHLGELRLVLNGIGTRTATLFKVKVYVMGLYLEKASSNDEEIVASEGAGRIVMHFVRKVDASKLRKGWDEGFRKNWPEADTIAKEIETFKSVMRDVRKGDRLVLDLHGDRVDVSFDDEQVAAIEGASFQKGLLSVWLGPEPPNEELKNGILGK